MNLLPIFTRDLCADRDQRRLHRGRIFAGAACGLVVVALALADRWTGGAVNIPRLIRITPIGGIVPFLLLMIGLSLGARLLATEYREGTLPLLLLPHVTGHDILLGKLLTALALQLDSALAAVPALVLPLAVAGFGTLEITLLALACVNLLFFGLIVGLFAAIFLDEPKAMTGGFLFVLPFLASPTPLVLLVPGGFLREGLAALHWLNPGEPLAHVSSVASGIRPTAFWLPLLGSHLLAWSLFGVGGFFLPSACRWRAGTDAGSRRWKRWAFGFVWNRLPGLRTRLLNRNPYLWLSSRSPWASVQIWLFLLGSPLVWGWLTWLIWTRAGLNVAVVFAIGTAATWGVTFLATIPAEAGRQLLADRQSGAIEMLLCTPFSTHDLLQGQWLALRRRYIAPLLSTLLLSLGLMVAGYATYGFGGMLDPDDRGFWLFAWLAGIILMPLSLTTLCWVAMRRTLTVRHAGEAGGIALAEVLGLACAALVGGSILGHLLFRWEPDWVELAAIWVPAYVVWLVVSAWRARRVLLSGLRQGLGVADEKRGVLWISTRRRAKSNGSSGGNSIAF